MAVSNAQRGAYFKLKTKRWLIAQGYQVADLEIVKWIYRPGGKPIPVKRDQFASDLLAVCSTHLIFVQVKGGAQCVGKGKFGEAQRAFSAFRWPNTDVCRRWVIAWAPRARAPRIIEC